MRHCSKGLIPFTLLLAATFVVWLAVGPPLAGATAPTELPRPGGEVVLSVTGNIAHTNSATGAEFDMAMLERLGSTKLRTSTPWTEGEPAFEGVSMRDLLEFVGARGNTVRAIALNDYVFDIAMSDFQDYRVVLAWAMNGQALSSRDKGPLWIVYPLDEFSGRRKQEMELRMVWQLVEIEVR
jgi:hypothetical protein